MNAGHHVVIIDNLCNSSIKVLDRIQNLAGPDFTSLSRKMCNASALDAIFKAHAIEGVIHLPA
jgi:UDP-glucose 4-epimerase